MTVSDGTVLMNRYHLDRLIGRGGMADVYAATDRVLDRPVAVKVMRDLTGDSSDEARFTAEARTLAQLTHPSLVTVLDAGTDAGRPFLVLELVDGPSLADLLPPPLAPDRVARIGAEVASALAHTHAAGIVHRDVKPGNILLGRDGRARLTDFGIARLLGDTSRHTKTGFTIGTAAYLAPEQVRVGEITPAADVYSLGLVMLEAVTGRRVYPGAPTEAALARLHAPPVVPDSIPPGWRETLTAMTSLEPSDRPTALQAADALGAPGDMASAPEQTRVLPGSPPPAEDTTHVLRRTANDRAGRFRATTAAALHRLRPSGERMQAFFRGRATSHVVLMGAVVATLLLTASILALTRGDTGTGAEDGAPENIPAPLREPMADLRDAVHGER